jgi:hypothetical protein
MLPPPRAEFPEGSQEKRKPHEHPTLQGKKPGAGDRLSHYRRDRFVQLPRARHGGLQRHRRGDALRPAGPGEGAFHEQRGPALAAAAGQEAERPLRRAGYGRAAAGHPGRVVQIALREAAQPDRAGAADAQDGRLGHDLRDLQGQAEGGGGVLGQGSLTKKNEKDSVTAESLSFHEGERRSANQARVDLGEDVADDRAEDQQNSNNNDCNQNKDQSVLDQALAFFLRGE